MIIFLSEYQSFILVLIILKHVQVFSISDWKLFFRLDINSYVSRLP